MAEKKEEKKKKDDDGGQDDSQKTQGKTTPDNQDSEDKVAKLEKKLGELGETVSSYKEFINGASVVINTIAFSPELREAFQSQLKKQYGMVGEGQKSGQQQEQKPEEKKTPSQSSGEFKEIDSRVSGVEVSQRERIINDFEDRYGISKLKDEERKEARKKIEGFLNDFGQSVKNVPLPMLGKSLERAFVSTHAEKLREEGKLEGFTQARGNDQATMPTMGSSSLRSEGENKDLTTGQKKWAEKLGVDVEKAKEKYFSQEKEATTPSKAEEKVKEEK